jgi:hypothetical protein
LESAALRSASLRFLLSFLLSFGDASDFYCKQSWLAFGSLNLFYPAALSGFKFLLPIRRRLQRGCCDAYAVMPS